MRAVAAAIAIAVIVLVVRSHDEAMLRSVRFPHARAVAYVADQTRPVLAAEAPSAPVVDGHVRDIYGNAIAAATVSWRSDDEIVETTTSETGAFSLVVAHHGSLEARADGYAPARAAPGRDVELVLVPEATIHGRVVTGATPLAGVVVRARGHTTGFSPIERVETRTASDGTFTLAGVSPGRWQLALDEPGWHAPPVEIEARAAAPVEVTLHASAGTRVSGHVVSDVPCTEPHVWLRSPATTLHARESLVFPAVPPGRYDVSAACGDEPPIGLSPIEVTSAALHARWELPGRAALHGRVIDERGRPVADATIAVAPDLPDARTDADGTFTITGRAGTYTLGVVTDDRRARSDEVLVPLGGQVTLVTRAVVALHARIDVPRPGIDLRAFATDGAGVIAETAIAADGTFAFHDLAPGPQRIAICDPWAGEIGAATLTSTATITTAPFTHAIEGRVIDLAGQPITDGLVTAAATRDSVCSLAHDGRAAVPLDDRGRFRLPALPTGDYLVEAASLDGRHGTAPAGQPIVVGKD